MKAAVHQQRQPAGVIDVRVAQDHGIESTGIDRQVGVEGVGFGAAALEQAGIEQDTLAPAASSRCIEPVTCPAAPWKVRRMLMGD